ncbi:MAG: AraC family transcriptional regulator [Oscillospiraceae bacterium]|jgi:effector-binding domain-containing protein|nr:AraC family transcriptional regulator [Oscillospiraceae bacterium]
MDIKEKQELRMSNVLSFRKRLSAPEFQQASVRISKFIEDGSFTKTAPTATATFAVEIENGQQMLDIEVLISLDKPFDPPEECVCKPEFLLTNAVTIRHLGNPTGLEDSYNKLMSYIEERGYVTITNGYNVTVTEPKSPADIDQMIIDIYIGVSPNIL